MQSCSGAAGPATFVIRIIRSNRIAAHTIAAHVAAGPLAQPQPEVGSQSTSVQSQRIQSNSMLTHPQPVQRVLYLFQLPAAAHQRRQPLFHVAAQPARGAGVRALLRSIRHAPRVHRLLLACGTKMPCKGQLYRAFVLLMRRTHATNELMSVQADARHVGAPAPACLRRLESIARTLKSIQGDMTLSQLHMRRNEHRLHDAWSHAMQSEKSQAKAGRQQAGRRARLPLSVSIGSSS